MEQRQPGEQCGVEVVILGVFASSRPAGPRTAWWAPGRWWHRGGETTRKPRVDGRPGVAGGFEDHGYGVALAEFEVGPYSFEVVGVGG